MGRRSCRHHHIGSLLRPLAYGTTVETGVDVEATRCRIKHPKRNPLASLAVEEEERSRTEDILDRGDLLEVVRMGDADPVPLAHAALRTARAIRVLVAETVHPREFDAGGTHHGEAIRLGHAAVD